MAYNHHLLPLADYLYKLYKSQSLCDLSITTKNGTTVLAHKLVVAAFSETVRTEVEKWKDLPQVSIVVDCETAVLTEILDFVYIGNCHLHKELFPLLQQASHSLQIPSLQKYLKEKGPTSRKSLQINHSEAKQKKETKALPNVENLRSRRNIKPKKAYHDEQFEWSGDLREPGDDIPMADDNDDNDGDALWEEEVRNEPRTSRRKGKPGKPDKLINQAYVRLERIDASVKQQSLKTTLRSTVTDKATRHTVNKSLIPVTDKATRHTVNKSWIPVKERKNKYTRENLTNLAKTKQTRNQKRNPLMNHSKHSIENIKHSMNNWKKAPAELLAWKCKKLYEKHHKNIGVKRVGYSCKICKVWHKNISHIKFHINLKHRNIQPKRRKFANKKKKKGSFEERKKKIERIKQKIKNCECFRCDRTYKLVRGLATHLVEKHKISFERAQKLTGYPKYFKYQNSTCHTCDDCKMEFNTLKDFRAHCRIVHKKKRLDPDMSCTYKKCSQKFLSMAKLKEHLVKFHKQKNVSIKCRQGRVSARVDKQDITTRLQKQRRLLEDLSVSSKEEQVKRKKEESFIKQINELSEITDSKNSSYPKKKIKYNVVLSSKKYRCNRCPKSSVCRNKLIHKNHTEIRHKKILVSKLFASQLVLKKNMCKNRSLIKSVTNNNLNLTSKSEIEDIEKILEPKVGQEPKVIALNEMSADVAGLTQEPKVVVVKEKSANMIGLTHYFKDENNSIEPLSDMKSNISDQLTLMENSALIDQNNPLDTIDNDSSGSLNNSSIINEKQKKCKRNQFTCLKCGLSFPYYSMASLHLKKKHGRHQLRQRVIFSRIKKHVSLRSVLFSRDAIETNTSNLLSDEKRPTKCDICDRTFSCVDTLAHHLVHYHTNMTKRARQASNNVDHTNMSKQARQTSSNVDPTNMTKPARRTSSNLGKQRITCVHCRKSLKYPRTHAAHLQIVHHYTVEQAMEVTGYPSFRKKKVYTKKPTKCLKCSVIFPTLKEYKAHEMLIHSISCKICGEKFSNSWLLKRHWIKKHPENVHDLEEMKTTSLTRIAEEEEKRKEAEQMFKCDNCDFTTLELNVLSSHIIETHPEVKPCCSVCGYVYSSQYDVELHMNECNRKTKTYQEKCSVCNKKFYKRSSLQIHQFKEHGIQHPNVKEYKCDFDGCKTITYTLRNFDNHKKMHTREKKYSCDECQFKSLHYGRLLRHVRSVHRQLRPHLCESCGKAYTAKKDLIHHIANTHTRDSYKFQCEYCPIQTTTKCSLQNHLWNQHKVKMADDDRQYFQCDQCTYQTPNRKTFANHMNSHNNIRNYICDQCDARFVTMTVLIGHQKHKHSTKDQHKVCSQCGFRAKTNSSLNLHIRVQHQLKGIKPYKCDYCDFKCATGGNCRKHIMGKHKGLPVHYTCDKEYLEKARNERKAGNTNQLFE